MPSRLSRGAIVCWLGIAGLFTGGVRAAEKWADPRLTVLDGLTVWLDATRATGEQIRPFDGKLAAWRDASGHGRDVVQTVNEAQPRLLPAGSTSIVRFDGSDDHLRAIGQHVELNSFTIITVAAPRRNLGLFRAVLAFNAQEQRDYTSGLTIDLGPAASADFSNLNVEGRGFGGARSLRMAKGPLRRLYTLEVTGDAAAAAVRLAVDGQDEGERPREVSPLSLDELTVGARYYNNGAGPQHVDGHGAWDIAELLVYDRAISAAERDTVRKYLRDKYAGSSDQLPPDGDGPGEALQLVENPPPVQVFWPGLEVREMPVELTNINNLKYRSDGTLVALGYDGRIWLLRDRDGDGIEDHADLFWENRSGLRSTIGMDLTPPGYERGEGVFVVGKTKCVLITDTNRDGQADQELLVAGGWKESFHNVDGLGVAFDPRDGSVYFGRGTYNFADPFLRDKEGRAHYSLSDESSTIVRVSPDFQKRVIVATGIRFPVALRLNRLGDLFATDQEGATWVPNGNPLDELLHIQPGRHYGFPARHPRDLPNVIDEPSTFDYAPQHQSTCGLNFNEPVQQGGPTFGPASWAGDALVAGYARGKLYRTQLVKSAAGYVARNQLLAALQMLTVDACVDPAGNLVVSCHSGGPDWGSGPTGRGKLYKIVHADRQLPQPSVVWPSGPREVRVELDRPVDPETLRDVVKFAKLTGGPYVRAGDRFETMWPGYAMVQMQKAAPRWDVPIRSAQLTPDRRSLVLAVDRLPGAVSYALTLPGMGRPAPNTTRAGAVEQQAAVDLGFDLTGCEAQWVPSDGGMTWQGWLPHLDLSVARAMTRDSVAHDALWSALEQPGTLTLRTQLDLVDMLRPAVQPGSQLDYELPAETVTVNFESPAARVRLVSPPAASAAVSTEPASRRASLTVTPTKGTLTKIELQLALTSGSPALNVAWTTAEDARPRPLPLRRSWRAAAGPADVASFFRSPLLASNVTRSMSRVRQLARTCPTWCIAIMPRCCGIFPFPASR